MVRAVRILALIVMLAYSAAVTAEDVPPPAAVPNSVLPLYRELRTVGLDSAKVFKVREATIDRDDLHIFLNDGTLIFTKTVQGRITGMYFVGDGELLVRPPNRTERESLGLFTNLGILSDKFHQAYFRFEDDVASELQPFLRPPDDEDRAEVDKYATAAVQLADGDSLRLLSAFTSGPAENGEGRRLMSDHFLHARIAGAAFGTYDLYYDTRAPEQIVIGQMAHANGLSFYDLWMSFRARRVRDGKADGVVPERAADSVHVNKCRITATIHPPESISAEAELDLEVKQGGPRILMFELSHDLHVKTLTLDDKPLEWIQNEALEGTQLARSGNDFVSVVLPAPCKPRDHLHLRFTYDGSVLSQAGNGLLFVGAHGIWYPNRGLTPSDYDLTFTYPQPWTLVATGKKISETQNGELRTSHWVSENPFPVAGFNLGQYVEAEAKAASANVEAYATRSVEKEIPTVVRKAEIIQRRNPWRAPTLDQVTTPIAINPSATTKQIAEDAAHTIDFYDKMLGRYPFSSLRITQFPAPDSQGWPGLIYLSTYTFLTPEQRKSMGLTPFVQEFFGSLMLRHEVAHMWWGHEVFWDTYRDQWLSEALANYSALLMTQQSDPKTFDLLLEGYREQLLSKREGGELNEAGPVTLGLRLNSAKFPDAYEAVAYGRGTWLIHMLRCMLEDETRPSKTKSLTGDELFLQVLRNILKRHRETGMNTDDLRHAFEEVWPESLRFEGRKSLDWFFDGWVNGKAIPTLEVSGVSFSKPNPAAYVSGTIRQKHAPDDLVTSVPVYLQAGEHLEYQGRVFAVGEETKFRLRVRGPGRRVILDPYHTVLTRP